MQKALHILLLCLSWLPSVYAQGEKIEIVPDLFLIEKSPSIYVHKTIQRTKNFGTFTSNGMIFIRKGSCVIFDTPPNDSMANYLLDHLIDSMGLMVEVLVVNHFHPDCMGGIRSFHDRKIPSWSNRLTPELARRYKIPKPYPNFLFEGKMSFKLKGKKVILYYPGQAHTQDNIVGYIPSEKALFGGCMVKSLGANRGYTGHANTNEWASTVSKVKKQFPKAKIVVPGHGKAGGTDLLDYTVNMFRKVDP
ncbi:MAG: subclass B1 metallo-beta-lactamase [Bacteroidota bacterium]